MDKKETYPYLFLVSHEVFYIATNRSFYNADLHETKLTDFSKGFTSDKKIIYIF